MGDIHGPSAAIRVMVVDDESLARRNVTVLLRGDPTIESVVECESGVEAIEAIRQLKPSLVFLDVQMPECDGFDVLEMLGGDAPANIIFVTAYDSYALRAFEAGALDYLLKPFDDARFYRALNRAKDRIAGAPSPSPSLLQRLVVKTKGHVKFVNVADIEWIDAAAYYACLHVGSDTHIVRRTMGNLERDLGDDRFVRIHRSVLVNLEQVGEVALHESGAYQVILKSKARLPLSRRYRKQLQDRLSGRGRRDRVT